MTPAARVQAAIELLDQIIDAAATRGPAADTLAGRFFASRRYAGSKDRRAVRDLVWQAIRGFGTRPVTGRSAMVTMADADPELAALFDGSDYGPAVISDEEPRVSAQGTGPLAVQTYLYDFIDEDELTTLTMRAPVDVRINRNRLEDDMNLPEGGEALSPPLDGRRYPTDTDLTAELTYAAGAIEVQDAGSQLIAYVCAVKPAMKVLDLCAGAGGKSLALAATMAGSGVVLACDTDRRRLGELPQRAQRARAHIIEPRLINPQQELAMLSDWKGQADVVLVDAPCSGSGTWRRNPEARWRIDGAMVRALAAQQLRLLHIGADLVTSGGTLVYAVCALTRAEGAELVTQFLAERAGWRAENPQELGLVPREIGRVVGPGLVVTPAHDAMDGFFFARLRAA